MLKFAATLQLIFLLWLAPAMPARAQSAAPTEVAPVRVEGRRLFDVGPRGLRPMSGRAARHRAQPARRALSGV